MQLNVDSSDIDVMRRVAAYDSKALEILYNRYSPLLYTLIKKIAVEKTLAEEILTEVFVIIWRRVELFDVFTGNVYTWLITLTRNKAVDTIRRNNENLKMPDYTDEYEANFIIPQISKQIDPLDLATTHTIKNSVETALNKLTDAQQYVIYLAYYEGLTQKGIAERLNIPYSTVKTKIKNASLNLREYLLKGDS